MKITIENPSVKEAVKTDAIKDRLIEILDISSLSPFEDYAILSKFIEAAQNAAVYFSNKAATMALTEPTKDNPNELYELASQQKEFLHRGFFYQVLFSCDHNYGEQRINGVLDPDSVKWKTCCAEIKSLSADLSSKRSEKTRLEKDLRRHHSNMEILNPHKSVKFMASKSPKNV